MEDFRNTITEQSDTLDWLNMISSQPTAYDVDLVSELKEYRELKNEGRLLIPPCAVGDTVYYRYEAIKIVPMRVEEIIITKYGINLLLVYCGSDEKLKYWKISIESTAIDYKIIFLTSEEAEAALSEVNRK